MSFPGRLCWDCHTCSLDSLYTMPVAIRCADAERLMGAAVGRFEPYDFGITGVLGI